MARKSNDERREERTKRRASERERRATLKGAGADARREYFWGNLLRRQRQRTGG